MSTRRPAESSRFRGFGHKRFRHSRALYALAQELLAALKLFVQREVMRMVAQ